MSDYKKTNDLTEKTTPVDADLLRLDDSADSFAWKKATIANVSTKVQADLIADDNTFTGTTTLDKIGLLKSKSHSPNGIVTFIMDDGNACCYTDYKPLFDAQGEVACPAIVTDWVGTTNFMTLAQLLELQTSGWEILSHTKTHPEFLSALTEAQIITELSESKAYFTANGLTVENMVYPSNDNDAVVRKITMDYYNSGRAAITQYFSPAYNTSPVDSYNMLSVEIVGVEAADIANYKTYIDNAYTNNGWMIFFTHFATAERLAAYDEIIDYIQAKNMEIVTVKQALEITGNYFEGGDGVAIGRDGIRANKIVMHALSADPTTPRQGKSVIWQSDGTGSGDDGDIMMKITAVAGGTFEGGGNTKTITLVDFSAS